MNRTEILKEGKNKSLKETVQDLKVETETIQKTQTKVNLEVKKLEALIGISEASFTNRTQEMEERIPGTEDMTEEMDRRNEYLQKGNVKP